MRLLLIGIATMVSLAAPALEAREAKSQSSVTACSRYGRGCVTGAVRVGRFDREVRLPGGSWIGCKRDCRETLREETVDFWETLRDRAPDNFR
jgi:hypothetical protein